MRMRVYHQMVYFSYVSMHASVVCVLDMYFVCVCVYEYAPPRKMYMHDPSQNIH